MNVFLVAFEILFIFNSISIGAPQIIPSNRTCVMQGTFEIVDGTCANYYICVFNGVEFVSYDMSCSPSMVFDPLLKYCTSPSNYICKQVTSSTSSSTSCSTPSLTPNTTSSLTPSMTPSMTPSTTPSTKCVTNGRFPIPGNCEQYYFCYVNGATIIRYDLRCPDGLKFNSVTQKCVLPCPGINSCPPCTLSK
ncbi:probable endochitinase [Bombus affinis]|uniref:probable endochitinase n=1 Tax=Bombus affinis TaxID=309941 RepID=UPI0021B7B745|nr:probable endochitinase [Bombus affinis]